MEPFDAVIMLTTRTKEQGVFRTIEPKKDLLRATSRIERSIISHIQIKESFEELLRVIIEAGGDGE